MAFDFSAVTAPFRMQPGLRRVAPAAGQLTPNVPGSRHLREKTAVLATTPREALCALGSFDESEVLRTVADESSRCGLDAFRFDEGSGPARRCEAPLLGWAVEGDDVRGTGDPAIGALLHCLPPRLRPSALVSLAFAEDFAVLDGESTTLVWLAVCLPSHWSPEDKLGLAFADVHAPVADGDMLRAAGAALARLVTGSDRWERSVWTVSADARLCQHPAHGDVRWPEPLGADARADAQALAATASLRSERQTFLPIAGTGRAVFTILVESAPLAESVTTADAARRLHDAVASMSPAVLAYRRLDVARDRLLAWLADRADALSVPR
jgi:hypothetical protein